MAATTPPTTQRPAVLPSTNGGTGRDPLVPIRRRRQRTWILAGVLLAIVGALGMVEVVTSLGGRVSALRLAHDVPAGHVLQASDLETYDVSQDTGLSLVTATQETSVVGRHLAVSVVSGAPLVWSDLGSGSVAAPGFAVVGVLVKPGQYPPTLAAGDHVQVVSAQTGSATGLSNPGATPQLPPLEATVLSVTQPSSSDTSTGSVVTLQVDQTYAAAVAAAGASGALSLVVLPPGS